MSADGEHHGEADDGFQHLVGMYKGDVPPEGAQDHDRYLHGDEPRTPVERRKEGRKG